MTPRHLHSRTFVEIVKSFHDLDERGLTIVRDALAADASAGGATDPSRRRQRAGGRAHAQRLDLEISELHSRSRMMVL